MDFTDKDETYYQEKGYVIEESQMGKVYYLDRIVEVTGPISVNYMEYPWMSFFEVEGLKLCKSGKRG